MVSSPSSTRPTCSEFSPLHTRSRRASDSRRRSISRSRSCKDVRRSGDDVVVGSMHPVVLLIILLSLLLARQSGRGENGRDWKDDKISGMGTVQTEKVARLLQTPIPAFQSQSQDELPIRQGRKESLARSGKRESLRAELAETKAELKRLSLKFEALEKQSSSALQQRHTSSVQEKKRINWASTSLGARIVDGTRELDIFESTTFLPRWLREFAAPLILSKDQFTAMELKTSLPREQLLSISEPVPGPSVLFPLLSESSPLANADIRPLNHTDGQSSFVVTPKKNDVASAWVRVRLGVPLAHVSHVGIRHLSRSLTPYPASAPRDVMVTLHYEPTPRMPDRATDTRNEVEEKLKMPKQREYFERPDSITTDGTSTLSTFTAIEGGQESDWFGMISAMKNLRQVFAKTATDIASSFILDAGQNKTGDTDTMYDIRSPCSFQVSVNRSLGSQIFPVSDECAPPKIPEGNSTRGRGFNPMIREIEFQINGTQGPALLANGHRYVSLHRLEVYGIALADENVDVDY